jgi:hypothetical protein
LKAPWLQWRPYRDAGKVVGRILESGSRFDPPDLLWTWSVTSIWPLTRGVTNGPWVQLVRSTYHTKAAK